ncbi:hypothetical protein BD413DRAFT_547157 [Trametes elegans]|nr:hypothetical protein BD413DRAFT_547157 [Trametes elegans]
MAKKKGPPYTDNPGCKYIVIEDPWPGNASGKARTEVYYNHLCTWVYFMLDKAHSALAVYSVNTRSEVIVQLPQEADLASIMGAHPWRRFLVRGDARDKDRVSYVFEYDYRNRGEPGNHNWLETFPSVSGDPPAHIRFPVLFPYPHVSWASPKGKNCADIVLPLPATRQPTPVPDTSLFAPYQHPSQLSAGTVNNAQSRPEHASSPEQQSVPEPAASGKLGKMDPYEQELNARLSLKRELVDDAPSVKREALEGRVKLESGANSVKSEPELHGPTKAFRQAFERMQQARATAETPTLPDPPRVKDEDVPTAPTSEFVEAFMRVRGAQTGAPERPQVKQDPTEEPAYEPTDDFRAAFEKLRGAPAPPAIPQTHSADAARVKSEPSETLSHSGSLPLRDEPRRGLREDVKQPAKRVKEENGDELIGKSF